MAGHAVRLALLALATLASALIAGFFYAYQWSVMPGLDAADPSAAIRAMQGINLVVRNAVFAFSFFGTLLFGIAAAVGFSLARHTAVSALLWAGALIYTVGGLVITFAFSVPLNDGLAAVSPTPETAPAIWRDYAAPWLRWNAVRTAASVVTLVLFTAALALAYSSRPQRAVHGGRDPAHR